MEVSFCKECGARLDATCRFCMSCGTPVDDWAANEAAESVGTAPARPSVVMDADKPTKKPKEKRNRTKRKTRGFGGAMLSTILCVFVFVFLLLLIGIVSVRQASSPLAIRKMLDGVELSELHLSKGRSLSEKLQDSMLEPLDITDDVSEIIDSETVRIAVADKLAAYLRDLYFVTGEGVIETEDVIALVRKLDDDIEECLGISLYSSDYELIEEIIGEQDILDDLSLAAFEKENPLEYQLLHWGLSYYAIAVLLGLSLLMVLLVHRSNKKAYRHTLSNIGWTLVIEGAVLLGAYYANKWILLQLSGMFRMDRALVAAVSKGILGAGLSVIYAMTIVGVVLVIAGIILKAFYKRMQRREAAGV